MSRIILESETTPLNPIQSMMNETCIEETPIILSASLEDTAEMPALPDQELDITVEEEPVNYFNKYREVTNAEPLHIKMINAVSDDQWRAFNMVTEIPADSLWMTNQHPMQVIHDPTLTVTMVPATKQKDTRLKPGAIIRKGKKISIDDIVPMSGITYDPEKGPIIIKINESHWIADGNYRVINYCIGQSHFELQLESVP